MKKYFEDKLDFDKFYTNGFAILVRTYYKDANRLEKDTSISPKIIAKGITAHLSPESYSNFIDESLRLKLRDKKEIDLDAIFKRYYGICIGFLNYKNNSAFPSKKKSETELIFEHIEDEKKHFDESHNFYKNFKKWEEEIIKEIKKVSKLYQEWVKNKYLSDSEDNSDKEARNINEKNEPLQFNDETITEILKGQLSTYGFFELEKIKTLSDQSKISLIKKISKNGLPYAIAMFDYLEFIQYLEKNHFSTKYKLTREISKWFNSDKEGRTVRGNINSLSKYTKENKDRYTAHKHKEKVIKDYEQLK